MPSVVIAYNQFPDVQTEAQVFARDGVEVVHTKELTSEAAWDAASRAEGLMVSLERVPAALIERMERCKVICRIGVGVDAIDIPAATARGIRVINVPDYAVDEVSAHAIALVMMHARRLPRLIEMVNTGIWWNPTALKPITRLRDMTLGVLGYGRIGRETARKGRGLGMRVIAQAPERNAQRMAADGVEYATLERLLRESDVLSLHAPLTLETRHVINRESLSIMKPTAFIVNTARGALIDEDALLWAVQNNVIEGAALDALQTEPPAPDHPLMTEPRIWITPHAAWYSEQSKEDVRVKGAEDVARVLRGEAPLNPVNLKY